MKATVQKVYKAGSGEASIEKTETAIVEGFGVIVDGEIYSSFWLKSTAEAEAKYYNRENKSC